MGRPSSFNDTSVYAAIARSIAQRGEVRLQTVVAETGISTGSLYHRFGSREGLMAACWLDALAAFQTAFAAALATPRPQAVPGLEAALATPRFCREDQARGLILACCRPSEMVSATAPEDIRGRLADIAEDSRRAIADFAASRGLPLERVRLALIGIPLGAVKLYLPGRPVPDGLDADIACACSPLLGAERAGASDGATS